MLWNCDWNSGLPGVTGDIRLCEWFRWFRNLARWFSIELSNLGFALRTPENHPAPEGDQVREAPFSHAVGPV